MPTYTNFKRTPPEVDVAVRAAFKRWLRAVIAGTLSKTAATFKAASFVNRELTEQEKQTIEPVLKKKAKEAAKTYSKGTVKVPSVRVDESILKSFSVKDEYTLKSFDNLEYTIDIFKGNFEILYETSDLYQDPNSGQVSKSKGKYVFAFNIWRVMAYAYTAYYLLPSIMGKIDLEQNHDLTYAALDTVLEAHSGSTIILAR